MCLMSKPNNTSVRVISQSPAHNQEMVVSVGPNGSRTFFRPIDPANRTRNFNKFREQKGGRGRGRFGSK